MHNFVRRVVFPWRAIGLRPRRLWTDLSAGQRAAVRRNSGRTQAITINTSPNVQTIVAPVGRSDATEKYMPSIDTTTARPYWARYPVRFTTPGVACGA